MRWSVQNENAAPYARTVLETAQAGAGALQVLSVATKMSSTKFVRRQPMTTAILTLRVDQELQMAAEGVLRKNESLPEFMEPTLRESIAGRRFQNEFISRGLASGKRASRDNEYFSADDVLSELERRLTAARNSSR